MARTKALWTKLPAYQQIAENELPTLHSVLVDAGRKWLEKRCSVILTELVTSAFEQPDAIGWDGWRSVLVECKASRSDFLNDAKKPFRQFPEQGVGHLRYFLVPAGLVKVDELPAGWGLLEYSKGKVRAVLGSKDFEANRNREVGMLLSAIRRLGVSSTATCSIRCYTIENKKKATLSVRKDEPQCS